MNYQIVFILMIGILLLICGGLTLYKRFVIGDKQKVMRPELIWTYEDELRYQQHRETLPQRQLQFLKGYNTVGQGEI